VWAAFNTRKRRCGRGRTHAGSRADELKQDRWNRLSEKAQAISAAKLEAKVGRPMDVFIDEIDDEAATCCTKGRRARD